MRYSLALCMTFCIVMLCFTFLARSPSKVAAATTGVRLCQVLDNSHNVVDEFELTDTANPMGLCDSTANEFHVHNGGAFQGHPGCFYPGPAVQKFNYADETFPPGC